MLLVTVSASTSTKSEHPRLSPTAMPRSRRHIQAPRGLGRITPSGAHPRQRTHLSIPSSDEVRHCCGVRRSLGEEPAVRNSHRQGQPSASNRGIRACSGALRSDARSAIPMSPW